ncbi:MAG: hypothetical protein GX259_00130 [Bacteroidales bacterium]|nr:hypothetical protein [Bacteroidales bacterium]
MHLFVTIPAINELDFIMGVLSDLSNQQSKNFTLVCCVNQPDSWWDDEKYVEICHNNVSTMEQIDSFCKLKNIPLILIDKCSKGKGWKGKECGVGWARKVLMDHVSKIASDDDIIVSLDADTRVEANYIAEIEKQFTVFTMASAMALPYFHRLQGKDAQKTSMLRYEIYLRCYAINLLRIDFPFAYTPIGSAMAARVSAYRKIRGLTATSSGEDFYFMMKLRKIGVIIPFCNTTVYPSSRVSNRVIFGTGPTVGMEADAQAAKYPVYSPDLFDEINKACAAFGEIFFTNSEKAMDKALKVFPDLEPEKLLKNNPSLIRFIHACYIKADAFAVYKYVKSNYTQSSDASSVQTLFKMLNYNCENLFLENTELHHQPIENLKKIRQILYEIEENLLKKKYNDYFAQRNNLKNPLWKFMS